MAFIALGNSFQVNSDALLGTGGNETVTALTDGGFAVAWTEREGNNAGGVRTWVRKFDAQGQPVSAVVEIDAHDNPDEVQPVTLPSIRATADGGFVVGYIDRNGFDPAPTPPAGLNSAQKYWTATFDSSGALQSQTVIDDTATQTARSGDISATRVAIIQASASQSGVNDIIVDGATIASGTAGTATDIGPRLDIADVGGSYVVAWASGNDIKAQVGPGGTPFVVNTHLAGSQNISDSSHNIAALTTGGFVLAWSDESGDGPSVRVRLFDSAGTALGDEIPVNGAASTSNQINPEVTTLANGRFLVTWFDENAGGVGAAQAQVFDSSGQKLGGLFTVATPEGSTPSAAALDSGNIVFTWTAAGEARAQIFRFAPATEATDDFNGDGKADVLFSNQGAVYASNYEWQVNDRALVGEGAVDLYDKSFSVQVVGDFDGDGKSDLIFQNPTTGGVWQWRLDGTTIVSQGAVDVGDASYHLLGSADFNGDGRDDLLFRNDAGFVYQWQMNGLVDTPLAVGPLDPAWHVQGAGDFNGDGRADILLRNISADPNENGAFFLWQMNGNAIAAQGGIERPPTDWKTLGIGDFDGDGKADFAVRNVSAGADNGAVWVYLMDGTTIKSQGAAGIADAATWHVQEIGDLDGDGKDDILFRNDAGYFYSWDMNGTTIASEGLLQGAAQWADPSFQIVTQHWDPV